MYRGQGRVDPSEEGYLRYGSGHLHQINTPQHPITDLERDALHRETSRTHGTLMTRHTLDPLGRTLRSHTRRGSRPDRFITGPLTPLQEWDRIQNANPDDLLLKAWNYDKAGQLIQRRDNTTGEHHHHYDKNGQITQARNVPLPREIAPQHQHQPKTCIDQISSPQPLHPDWQESFIWDNSGNFTPGGSPQIQGRVEHNRVTVWQDIRYTYDPHGRLIRKQSGSRSDLSLIWDDQNQLTQTTLNRPDCAPQTVYYHYDALGRRTGKTDAFNTTWYIWDGMRMVQEQRGDTRRSYVYTDDGSYDPLARIDHQGEQPDPAHPPKILYFHNNINGAPEELTDPQGKLIWQARYHTWGNLALETWHTQATQQQTQYNPDTLPEAQNLRFQGQYHDPESGLHYNTFRYYDPDIGRFITPDPIGLEGGINLYQYAPNPIHWIDPWGWTGVRRTQTSGDQTLPTARAARREAMRSKNIPTSQSYQVEIHESSTQSDISKQRSGVLHEERIMRDGKHVGTVDVHGKGHTFPDGTYEKPHYHGKNGEHISYERGVPRNSNKYRGIRGDCF